MTSPDDQLPNGWEAVPIGDLCDLINGRAFKPEEWSDSGLPIIRIQNLNNSEASFNHFNGDYDNKHLVNPGELLFAWSGTPGTSFGAHVWHGKKALLNQHIFRVLIPEQLLNKEYYRFAINHKLEELIAHAHGGVGLRHVTKGKFEATEVLLPPLAEQRRIVAKIDSLQERSRKARDLLAEVRPLLAQVRQSLLAAAFRGDLTADWRKQNPDVEPATELLNRIRTERRQKWEQAERAKYEAKGKKPTKGWRDKVAEPPNALPDYARSESGSFPDSVWMPIEYAIAELQQGWSPKCKNEPSPNANLWGVIKTSAVMPMEYLDHANKWLPEELEPRPELELQPEDVLITRAGPRRRAAVACFVPQTRAKLMVCDKVYRIRCDKSVALPRYIEIVLNAPQCVTALDALKTGTSDSGVNLTQSRFRKLIVPIPSLGEQKEIITAVDEAFGSVTGVQDGLATSEEAVSQLDRSILAKAFRGELVAQDPNDEPASALLERIRDTRALHQNVKSKGKGKQKRQAVRQSIRDD